MWLLQAILTNFPCDRVIIMWDDTNVNYQDLVFPQYVYTTKHYSVHNK
jgi:hypothetical protein